MAYDEQLADRIRSLASSEPALSEQKMFGGLAFLVNGNMAVAASGQGGLLVRVDPEESGELVETTSAEAMGLRRRSMPGAAGGPVGAAWAEEMVMRGRSMAGWLRVESGAVEADDDLRAWVDRGLSFARSLPPQESRALRGPAGPLVYL